MIVLTGLGAVGASGTTRSALEQALLRGEPVVAAIDRVARCHHPDAARLAALVDHREVERQLSPAAARRMSSPSRFAAVAAAKALEDAGVAVPDAPDPGIAVVMATALGPMSYTQRMLDQIMDDGPAAASPMLFSECVANAPAARIAIDCRAAGLNFAVAQAEAGPLRAVARGAREITAGRARIALAGAVDEMSPLVHSVLDRFRALARPGRRPERPRPFDLHRDGFLAAEGATIVVLEEEGAARKRGAPILARLRGAWSAFDHTASASGWGDGVVVLARRLAGGLDRYGLSPARIGLIVSGASGSVSGDRLEALVLREAWGGSPLPPIITPKATTGEYGGAFLGAAALIASGARWNAGSSFDAIDPRLGVQPQASWSDHPRGAVLVTGLAAGGAASWLVLEHP